MAPDWEIVLADRISHVKVGMGSCGSWETLTHGMVTLRVAPGGR
jgi:hypothetical protein